jgi:S1-C subfamily serine protease
MFDPELDAALIYAPGLAVDPLDLADERPERGQVAAAVGFPGGGRQMVIAAAINRTIEALGRDIYGTRTVAREVIEMTADVRPGDSGGPVLLADGSVGGVTFSESRSDGLIGYALTPTAVSESIAGAVNSQVAVSTQSCLPTP